MGVLSAVEVLDRVAMLGGNLALNGERIWLQLPDCPEANTLAESVRRNRDAIAALLRDRDSKPPSLDEVRATLPAGVRLVSYSPKVAPFAVVPISIVTNAGKFFRAYLADLKTQLEKSEGYTATPLVEIKAKLAEAGLELEID